MSVRWIAVAAAVVALTAAGGAGSAGAASKAAGPVVTLTSVTVDPEDAQGATTNAPGGWSSNLADPLSQVGVRAGSAWLNQGPGLGEVAVPLSPGRHVLRLYGTGVFPGTAFYGLVLFFDGHQTPPDVTVTNSNPGARNGFRVQPAGTVVMGGANGGLFFDKAPGTATYTAPSGATVTVTGFSVDAVTGAQDRVGAYAAGPDGVPDMTATVSLKVTAP